MTSMKKSAKKFLSGDLGDFINESQFLKESPRPKKNQKRQKNETVEEDDISKLIGQYQASTKKRKTDASVEVCKESRQKLIDVMTNQLEARKQGNHNMLKSLSEVLSQLEADYNAMKDNEQKLEHLTGALIKCIQQATTAHKQKLKALKDIHASFKKEAEGLLTRGAMNPDDRPLWFDVYKAFPPTSEPKFAKPLPEIKPIKQILYKEDAIRAKFHSKGHGLAVNMLYPQGETHGKRLIEKYQALEAQGVPESELLDKSVAEVASERSVVEPVTTKTPSSKDSITSQIMSEAELENILKDK